MTLRLRPRGWRGSEDLLLLGPGNRRVVVRWSSSLFFGDSREVESVSRVHRNLMDGKKTWIPTEDLLLPNQDVGFCGEVLLSLDESPKKGMMARLLLSNGSDREGPTSVSPRVLDG